MKHNYSIGGNNKLIIKAPGKKRSLPAEGRLGIDKDNRLIYWLNEPAAWRRIYGLPKKIVFKGSWRLNKNHDLELILNKTRNQFDGDILSIKSLIISPVGDSLAFEVKSLDRNGLLHAQILRLSVIWLADERNQLSFIVKKHIPDILTLEGEWKLNRNQQIIYTYEKTELKRKAKVSKTITFEGHWEISRSNRLTYILKNSLDSRFDFRAQIETPNIYPQQGQIKYRLGSGIKESVRKKKTVYIYGAWKFSRSLGLSFQVDYGDKGVSQIEFGGDISFGENNKVSFALKNSNNEPIGVNVIFTHKFLKPIEAEALLRLKASSVSREAQAGVRFRF